MNSLSPLERTQLEIVSNQIARRYAPEQGHEEIESLIATHLRENPDSADLDLISQNINTVAIMVNRQISLSMFARNDQARRQQQSQHHASGPGWFAEDEMED